MTSSWPEPHRVVYIDQWAASPCTARAAAGGVRWCWTAWRRWSEVRRLERIAVLPVGWDAAGRHATGDDLTYTGERPPGRGPSSSTFDS